MPTYKRKKKERKENKKTRKQGRERGREKRENSNIPNPNIHQTTKQDEQGAKEDSSQDAYPSDLCLGWESESVGV